MLRRLVPAIALALFFAPAAAADPVAQILDAKGRVIAAPGPGSFDYPKRSGALLHIGSASVTSAGVELKDVALLGGRIQAVSISLPPRAKRARVEGLYVDGQARVARVNRLVPLSVSDYLITSQAAVGPKRRIGVVGLRLSLGAGAFGLPAGSQILVGLPARPRPAKPKPAVRLVKVATPLTVLGFMDGAVLAKFAPPASASSSPFSLPFGGTIGQRAVAIALRYLGIPYVYAGADPVTGFDCSGLTMYVYDKLGVHIDHWTGYQIHQGTPVPKFALQPGDLVFFYDEGGVPGHVGIYMGSGQFIHAPHTGDVVKISPLAGHYSSVYVGAVRPY